jgi:hydroxyethylthiazole kinase-like uncharacterized protein yjeF
MNNTQTYFSQVHLPLPNSHKGQNGKLLIIGGSELFHAASKWSLDIASKFVDMVFYASVPSNNELVEQAKGNFWNGIVVKREEITNYIEEADCILIGPGMTRDRKVDQQWTRDLLAKKNVPDLSAQIDWEHDTYAIINFLLTQFPKKKWVVDAGALQMLEPVLLNPKIIITPHLKELETVLKNLLALIGDDAEKVQITTEVLSELQSEQFNPDSLQKLSKILGDSTVILKGEHDWVFNAQEAVEVTGGNAGMTKGGTGDVLAGLVAGLYTQNEAFTSAIVASTVNKKAGDSLYHSVGPFFNSTDLVSEIPKVLWQEITIK